MIWVGLTGGIGCGKSTALNEFKKLGCGVVSADELVHGLYQDPGVIYEVSKILSLDPQSFSKNEVAKKVFGNSKLLSDLEKFIHPKIKEEVLRKKKDFSDQGVKVSFYEVPLLFEKSLQSQFDFTVCVFVDEETQIKRIKSRNTWTESEIDKRLSHQLPISEKRRLSDFEINNSNSLKDLQIQCSRVLSQILENQFKI